MAMIKGFDSRSWNGYLPSGTGYKYVGIKVSQGIAFAPSDMYILQRQWEWSKSKHGLLRMPFHFMLSPLWANPEDYGKRQAEYMFTSMSKKFDSDFGELPPVIDIEHRPAIKDDRVARCAKACLERTAELWDTQPVIYTAGWFWDQYVFPFVGDWKPWEIYDLWEADPPPPTPIKGWGDELGEITQTKLEYDAPGFNANIDENETTQAWLDKVMFEEDEVKEFSQEEVDAMLAEQSLRLSLACDVKCNLVERSAWNEAVEEAVEAVEAIAI